MEGKLFAKDHAFRPALRSLVDDPRFQFTAIALLAEIGDPQDLDWIIKHLPAPKPAAGETSWADVVLGALVEPATEDSWAFLRRYALAGADQESARAEAIQTLLLNGSPRARRILSEVHLQDPEAAKFLAESLASLTRAPAPLEGPDLPELAERLARWKDQESWSGNDLPFLNEHGDKARVGLDFVVIRCRFTHIATFHRVGAVWKLRGLRFHSQALLREPPSRKD